jgi:hypothetical protein
LFTFEAGYATDLEFNWRIIMPFIMLFVTIVACLACGWILYEMLKTPDQLWVVVHPEVAVYGPYLSVDAAELFISGHPAGPVMEAWPVEKYIKG